MSEYLNPLTKLTEQDPAPVQPLYLPSTPATAATVDFLTNSRDLKAYKENAEALSHGREIKVQHAGSECRVISKKGATELTLYVPNVDALGKSNKGLKKLYAFLLIKINQQAYSNGEKRQDFITFSLNELVENGTYKSINSARNQVKNSLNLLLTLLVGGEFKVGKTHATQGVVAPVFTMYTYKGNNFNLKLNPDFNFDVLTAYLTAVPNYFFALNSKAFDLLNTVLYYARQDLRETRKKGFFTISFKVLQTRLGLPNEENTKNPSRDIIEPVLNATKKVNEIDGRDLKLTPIFNTQLSAKEIIKTGLLKVELSPEYLNNLAPKRLKK